MTELLLNWLNNEIVLSKNITNIPIDFQNGYLFAELLYKTKQIPKLSTYKNTNNYKDIIFNFCHLQKNFLDMGVVLDENSRNEIMSAGPYTSKIYLFKIKQILSKKNIDLNQLKIRESNTLQKLYNKLCFKNENEKYLYNLQLKIGNREKKELRKSSSATYLPILGKSIENILNNKYTVNGSIYNEFKKKYAHLNFSDNDIKIIMEDMKENENKLLYLKEMVTNTENKRKIFLNEKNEEDKKRWEKSMINMEKFKIRKLKESWEPALRFKLLCQNNFKKSANNMAKVSDIFDNNLKFLIDDNKKKNKKEKISSEIIMLRMRQKLDEKIKNKRDKEKRERKRLKEEQEMNYRIFSQKNMNDMVNLMENNMLKNNIENNEQIKEKENKEENFNVLQKGKSRNSILKNVNENTDTTDLKLKEEILKTNEESENNKIKEITEKERMGVTATSSYSKLTANDYGLGLINECYSIHNFNVNVNDRIKLFKTLILPINSQEIENKFKKLPKIDMNSSTTNQSIIKNNSCSNIFDRSTSLSGSNIYNFDKNLYLEEIDKLKLDEFSKEYEEKKKRNAKKKNLIFPILNQILELTEYIGNYQEQNGVYLIDNSKWDELMIKFKNDEKMDDDDENKNNIKEEDESQYLFDYSDKLTNEDNKRIFDYVNYIDTFNDLIIPNELRGKKFSYPELYKEFYSKASNHGIDIKEYEPNEEESENLYLPKNPNIKNFKLSDIIENMIEYKKEGLNANNTNIFERKGKYYYIPIKMVINGYPLSGKKTQSSLLNEKYKGIKVYNPQKILENKIKEYKEIKAYKEQPEVHASAKGKHKNKKEESKKEIEDKIKEFEPVLKIINPYIDYINKIKEKENKIKKEKEEKKENEKKEGEKKKGKKKKKNKTIVNNNNEDEEKKSDITQDNNKTQENNTQDDNSTNIHNSATENHFEKDELLSDIYLKLIIYQLEKDFPDNKNAKMKFVEDLRGKYKEYINLKEKIKELKNKISEEEIKEKEITDPKSKNKKKQAQIIHNLNKELDNTIKLYNTSTNSLYVGFVIINFPKNLIEAEKLEKYFTGYESEFEKDPETNKKKLFSYANIIDINVKNSKNKNGEFSWFDLFIELNISPNEVDRRYNGCKYDPLSGTIYHMDDNPPAKEDKKKEGKLISGIPNLTKEEFYKEKTNYEKNIRELQRLYKAMNNGFNIVYKNIDQMDTNYIRNLNNSLENTISELIFNNYYNNVDNILNNINNINNSSMDKNKEDMSNSSIHPENNDNTNSEAASIELLKNINNNNNINNHNNKIYEELLTNLDTFNLYYKSIIRNFIHFMGRQRDHVINYLTIIQNEFITYLNRKTEKTEIAEIYIQKYNSLLENHPEIKNNPTVYNELSEDIKDVTKSIWVNIQNKKNNDVKYLQDLKNSGVRENEIDAFWEYIVLIFEAEVQKYLIICEIIIRYYLSKYGSLFNNINHDNINKGNNNNYKINYKKYLFDQIDLPPDFFNKMNTNYLNNNHYDNDINFERKRSNMSQINEVENKEDNNDDINMPYRNKKRNMDEKVEQIFMNSLKIIIREDVIIKQYIDKIKDNFQIIEKEFKPNVKLLSNTSILTMEGNSKRGMNSIVSARTLQKKKNMKKTKTSDFMVDNILYEDIMNQLINEKRKFKYRLMFLKHYAIRYSGIINECYNETYSAMDDLIIMSVRSQNNTLNEFMNYLNKSLNNFVSEISLDNFEFDSYDIYRRYKVDIGIVYDKMKFNAIFNIDRIKIGNNKEEKKKLDNEALINEEDLSYIQLFAYNLNDLMYIYYYIKTFGAETCNFLVKYDIVKEVLVHQYFTKKKYGIFENKNDNNNNNSPLSQFLSEENNGICKQILFSSNINYINFLNKFTAYNNNYININELFTCLLLLGSQLITSETLFELIKEHLPENKKELKNILLTKEEFLKIPLWFEKDDYLNILVDSKEQENYLDITKYYYTGENTEENNNIENKNKPIKINSIKEAIFEINSEENILNLNKIITILNKINNIEEIKEEKKDKDIQMISDLDINKKVEGDNKSLNEDVNKYDMSISKGKETDSKITLTIQSDLDIKRKKKHHDNKENINNIFNALFIN